MYNDNDKDNEIKDTVSLDQEINEMCEVCAHELYAHVGTLDPWSSLAICTVAGCPCRHGR